MSARPDTRDADVRSATSTARRTGNARVGARPRAFDHYLHGHPIVARSNRPTTAQGTAPTLGGTAASPLPDEDALRLAHVVAMLGARRPTIYERHVKPVIDRCVAAVLLVLGLPVLALTAVAVWLSVGSPILLRQARVGRRGRSFYMFKFRTMHPDRRGCQVLDYRGPERRVTHKSPQDPRHTPLGRKLRKASLDELPQLFNVLRGEMSLVGPRPEMVEMVAQYRGWQHARHAVKPGITGLWQVTERPNGGLMHEHTELDLAYIEHLSFRSDLKIIVRTPLALLRRNEIV
jgi:lipopolysaccharide/colanic/teichoic acid biosynthesis glycosyltransferase